MIRGWRGKLVGCCFGGQRCDQDPHRANAVCFTCWQSSGWSQWPGGRLWPAPWVNRSCISCFIVLPRPNSCCSPSRQTGTWKLRSAVPYVLHSNWYPALSLKNETSSCLARTFKHCKITIRSIMRLPVCSLLRCPHRALHHTWPPFQHLSFPVLALSESPYLSVLLRALLILWTIQTSLWDDSFSYQFSYGVLLVLLNSTILEGLLVLN